MNKHAYLLSLVMLLAPLAGCTSSTDSPVEEYEFSVDYVGTPTSDMDLLFVLQLDSNVSIDSIVIPLDVSNNQIIYNFSSEGNQDILSINYEIEEVFVSRSCGFKAIFNNVTVTSDVSNDWIIGLTETLENTITIPTIDNESSAHLQIFH